MKATRKKELKGMPVIAEEDFRSVTAEQDSRPVTAEQDFRPVTAEEDFEVVERRPFDEAIEGIKRALQSLDDAEGFNYAIEEMEEVVKQSVLAIRAKVKATIRNVRSIKTQEEFIKHIKAIDTLIDEIKLILNEDLGTGQLVSKFDQQESLLPTFRQKIMTAVGQPKPLSELGQAIVDAFNGTRTQKILLNKAQLVKALVMEKNIISSVLELALIKINLLDTKSLWELKELYARCNATDKDLEKATHLLGLKTDENEKLEKQTVQFRNSVQELQGKIEALQSKSQKDDAEMKRLKGLDEYNKEIVQALRKDIAEKISINAQLEQQIEEYETLSSEVTSLRKALSFAEGVNLGIKSELAQLNSRFSKLQDEKAGIEESFARHKQEKQRELEALQLRILELEEQLAEQGKGNLGGQLAEQRNGTNRLSNEKHKSKARQLTCNIVSNFGRVAVANSALSVSVSYFGLTKVAGLVIGGLGYMAVSKFHISEPVSEPKGTVNANQSMINRVLDAIDKVPVIPSSLYTATVGIVAVASNVLTYNVVSNFERVAAVNSALAASVSKVTGLGVIGGLGYMALSKFRISEPVNESKINADANQSIINRALDAIDRVPVLSSTFYTATVGVVAVVSTAFSGALVTLGMFAYSFHQLNSDKGEEMINFR